MDTISNASADNVQERRLVQVSCCHLLRGQLSAVGCSFIWVEFEKLKMFNNALRPKEVALVKLTTAMLVVDESY